MAWSAPWWFCEAAASFTRVLSPVLNHQYFKMFNWNKYAIFQHQSIQFDFYVFFFQFSNVACVLTAMVKCIFCIFSGPPILTFPGPASLNSQFERFEERDLEGVRQPPKRRFPAKQRLWYPQITCSCTPHLEVGWWYFWMCFSGYFLLSTM